MNSLCTCTMYIELLFLLSTCAQMLDGAQMTEQGWRSGESAHLLPRWPGFNSSDSLSYVG